MRNVYGNTQLSLRQRVISKLASRHLAHDNAFARQVALPLFEAGVETVGLTERINYGWQDFRTVPNHKYTILYQGSMHFGCRGKYHELRPGDIAFLPAGEQGCRFSKGKSRWIYFEIRKCERWEPMKAFGPYHRHYEQADALFVLLSHILDVHQVGKPSDFPLALAYARTIVGLLDAELALAGTVRHAPAPLLRKLAEEMAQKPDGRWSLQEMTKRVNCTERHFRRLFRKEFGQSPLEMLLRQRMSRAAHLLAHSDLSIETIAGAVGYENPFSFSRLFKKHIGIPPSAYRHNQARAEPAG
jgi:AraC-like DNA-binding protein